MEKVTYYIVTIKQNSNLRSYAIRIPNYLNLWPILNAIAFDGMYEIESINACDTKKEAIETARAWNDSYEKNGYLLPRPYRQSGYTVDYLWK